MKKLEKKLGLLEIEHIEDPCEVTIAVNPKEYIQKFTSDEINNKHKSLCKGMSGMDITNYGCGINSVKNIERFGKVQNEFLSQHRFSVKHNEMQRWGENEIFLDNWKLPFEWFFEIETKVKLSSMLNLLEIFWWWGKPDVEKRHSFKN